MSAVRSVSAASTTSISGSGPSGASWATAPMRTPRGSDTPPPSAAISPRMIRNKVVLPEPLRPTIPTRAPSGTANEA